MSLPPSLVAYLALRTIASELQLKPPEYAPISQADGHADTYDNGCPILSEPQRDDI